MEDALTILLVVISATLPLHILCNQYDNHHLYEGHWTKHNPIRLEYSNSSLCPLTRRTHETSFSKYECLDHGYSTAEYFPPFGYAFPSLSESIQLIRKSHRFKPHLGSTPLRIMMLGDSIMEQWYMSGLCSLERDHLEDKATVQYHRMRFFRDNPCGCDISANSSALQWYASRHDAPCDDDWMSLVVDEVDVLVVGFGFWFGQVWLDCGVDVTQEYTISMQRTIPLLNALARRGVIVVWTGLSYRVLDPYMSALNDPLYRSIAAEYLNNTSIIVVDPYEVVKQRVHGDRSVRHDGNHFCGYGPHSVPVFFFRTILAQIAHYLH